MRTPTITDWRGTSHARMTAAMHRLGASPFKILSHLRRIIPDGETRCVSQAQIARATGLSEGTISLHMPSLVSAGYIVRTTRPKDGRGHGYAITVVAPPLKGSTIDPYPAAPVDRIPMQESASEKGSNFDPSYHIDHDQNQQQQQAGFDSDLLQEFAGDDPQVVAEVLAANPGLTVAEFAGQLAIATERPDVRCPRGLVFDCLRKGQRVTPARRAEPRPDAPRGARNDKKPWDTPESLAAYFAAQSAAQAAEHTQDCEPPDDMTDEERAWWHERIAAGYTSHEVLNGLLTWRYQAGALPIGGVR